MLCTSNVQWQGLSDYGRSLGSNPTNSYLDHRQRDQEEVIP